MGRLLRRRHGNAIDRIAAHGRRHRIAVFTVTDSIVDWPVVVDTDLDRPCEIGSVSKVVTGLLAASLDSSGRCPLDSPIHDVLGIDQPVVVDGDPVTVDDLVTHHSGLPRLPAQLVPDDPLDPYRSTKPDEVVSWLLEWSRHGAEDAHRVYDYSNFGFAVLGIALSRAAGVGWERAVDDLLADLGVEGVHSRRPGDDPLAAAKVGRGRVVPHWEMGAFVAAGGLVATPTGLAQFATRLLEAAADPDDAMHETVCTSMRPRRGLGPDASIGLAWHVARRPDGERVAWHNGATGGSTAFLALRPTHGRAVGMLASGDPDDELERWVGSLLDRTAAV